MYRSLNHDKLGTGVAGLAAGHNLVHHALEELVARPISRLEQGKQLEESV